MPYPTIMPPVEMTNVEHDLFANEPPGLFPDNQDSVYGQLRKVMGDYLQSNIADTLGRWWLNLDPRTVDDDDMGEWEEMVGVPYRPSGRTLDQRRSYVENRLIYGAFTRGLAARIIESFVLSTFGVPIILVPEGVPMDVAGVPLYSDATGPLPTHYRVYFDVANFIYYARVDTALGLDTAGVSRELQRVTPGGITLNFSAVANVLDYQKSIIDHSPIGYWRLGASYADLSPYGITGTASGTGLTAIADPGLIASTAISGGNGATDFNGTTGFVTLGAHALTAAMPILSIGALINADTAAAAGAYRTVFAGGNGTNFLSLFDTTHTLVFSLNISGTQRTLVGPVVSLSATHRLVGTYDGHYMRLYLDGALVATSPDYPGIVDLTGAKYIGRQTTSAHFFDGRIDEVVLLDHVLTDAEVLTLYNTGLNIP